MTGNGVITIENQKDQNGSKEKVYSTSYINNQLDEINTEINSIKNSETHLPCWEIL